MIAKVTVALRQKCSQPLAHLLLMQQSNVTTKRSEFRRIVPSGVACTNAMAALANSDSFLWADSCRQREGGRERNINKCTFSRVQSQQSVCAACREEPAQSGWPLRWNPVVQQYQLIISCHLTLVARSHPPAAMFVFLQNGIYSQSPTSVCHWPSTPHQWWFGVTEASNMGEGRRHWPESSGGDRLQ